MPSRYTGPGAATRSRFCVQVLQIHLAPGKSLLIDRDPNLLR